MHWTIIYRCIMILIQVVNVLLHTGGLYLIASLRKNGKANVQILLVMNLSISELMLNMTYIVMFALNIRFTAEPSHEILNVMKYTDIISGLCVNLVYYLTMIYISINKMLEVLMNLKYEVYCNKNNAKNLLFSTWLLAMIVCTFAIISEIFLDFRHHTPMTCFYTTLDIVFILIAITSHSYIFYQYRQSQNGPNFRKTLFRKKYTQSLWRTFKGSRFYLSFFLITAFVVLTIIPKLIAFFVFPHLDNNRLKLVIGIMVGISYHISFMVNGFIYVFMHKSVKKILLKKFRKYRSLKLYQRSSLRHVLQTEVTISTPYIASTCV